MFLPENNRRIRDRCDRLEQTLNKVGVPFLAAEAGLFLWMDLREFLTPLSPDDDNVEDDGDSTSSPSVTADGRETVESMERRERELYLYLLNDFGLLFTPGLSMKNELPGFFRCVFTAASDDEFDLALVRVARAVREMRERSR